MPVPKLVPKCGAELMPAPPRKPDEENPPCPIDAPPPREPPCIWANKGTASNATDNAAMANQRRIQGIIALSGALNCQIFIQVLAPATSPIIPTRDMARSQELEASRFRRPSSDLPRRA